jgi:hypothetical protein
VIQKPNEVTKLCIDRPSVNVESYVVMVMVMVVLVVVMTVCYWWSHYGNAVITMVVVATQ